MLPSSLPFFPPLSYMFSLCGSKLIIPPRIRRLISAFSRILSGAMYHTSVDDFNQDVEYGERMSNERIIKPIIKPTNRVSSKPTREQLDSRPVPNRRSRKPTLNLTDHQTNQLSSIRISTQRFPFYLFSSRIRN